MKVIICGAGQVGWQIARHLAGENNDVTVVDNNPDLVRRAMDTLDVRGVTGFASHPDVLDKAGARDAEMIIAATYSDEVNMVTCQVAHTVFKVNRKIARLRNQSYLAPRYADLYQKDHMPIDVIISPEREVAEAAMRRLAAPAAFDIQVFHDGMTQLIGLDLDDDCPVLNTGLRQLTELFSSLRAIVVGVRRDGKLFVPGPKDQLFSGDQIYVTCHTDDLKRTMEIFGKSTKTQERIVIIGGGNVGLGVAQALEKRTQRVRAKVIERDRIVAEYCADSLSRTIVLNGDGLSHELLAEASIDLADAILCVTDDDKTNMLAAVRGKSSGAKMAICLVNDPTLVPILAALDIDAYINPRATTVSSILRHIRHGRVKGVYSVGDAEAELIEAQVMNTSQVAGKLIRDIPFPEGVMVGAIKKGNKVIKPTGDVKIEEHDILAIFAMAKDVPELERLLQVQIDFF